MRNLNHLKLGETKIFLLYLPENVSENCFSVKIDEGNNKYRLNHSEKFILNLAYETVIDRWDSSAELELSGPEIRQHWPMIDTN